MKLFFLPLILLAASVQSQTKTAYLHDHESGFREVKTAEDVLYNYILASGGREIIDTLTSIFFTGELSKDRKKFKFDCFMSRDRFHYRLDDKNANELSEFGRESMQFLNLSIYEHSGMTVHSGFIFYLAYKFSSVKANLQGTRGINSRECYKVEFTIPDNGKERFIKTAYFDKETFFKLRTVNRDYEKNKFDINFSDYREVNGTGLFMPFEFENQFKFTINEYLLNEDPGLEW